MRSHASQLFRWGEREVFIGETMAAAATGADPSTIQPHQADAIRCGGGSSRSSHIGDKREWLQKGYGRFLDSLFDL